MTPAHGEVLEGPTLWSELTRRVQKGGGVDGSTEMVRHDDVVTRSVKVIPLVVLTAHAVRMAHGQPRHQPSHRRGFRCCISAIHSLPKTQEATYTVFREKFSSPEKVLEHPCCYPAHLDELVREGPLENSLRDSTKYWSQYLLTGPGGHLDQVVHGRVA